MAFLNSSLMFGGLLIALPLIIHMAMRRKPVPQLFPALRFVQQKQVSNQRTVRMKQWLLLLLRCLLLAGLALALSGPSADQAVAGNWMVVGVVSLAVLLAAIVCLAAALSEVSKHIVISLAVMVLLGLITDIFFIIKIAGDQETNLIGDVDAAVGAALVFDNSPRMSYQQAGKSRLAEAADIGSWLASQFPESSEISVVDRSARQAVFSADLNSTMNAIEQLQIEHTPVSLDASLRSAISVLQTSEWTQREIYLFTDLSRTAWESVEHSLRETLETQQIELFVIDVGVEQPANVALSTPEIQDEFIVGSSGTEIHLDVSHIGLATTRTMEFVVEEVDLTLPVLTDGVLQTPALKRLAQQDITFEASESMTRQTLRFAVSDLPPGIHHGQIRLLGGDGLGIDDVKYFTISVGRPSEILVVTANDVPTRYFTQAIAPQTDRQTGRARFEFTTIRNGNITERELERFATVVLIDPLPLPTEAWQHLAEYVEQGGSLGVFLGPNMTLENLSQTEAIPTLLGGTVQRLWRSDERNFLEPSAADHPVLVDFSQLQGSVPWAQFPVLRYWQMEKLGEGAQTIMHFSRESSHPALLENRHGDGTVMTMLTPISEPLRLENRTPWNQLASANDNWPYFLLINSIADTLVANRESKLNYQVGDVVTLRNDGAQFPAEYQLFTPTADLQQVQTVENRLQVSFIPTPGAYRLKGQQDGPVLKGFAVNSLEAFSDLQRLEQTQLDSKLGQDSYQLARNQEDISFGVRQRRIGQEFFSILILLVIVLFVLEHLMASRFYAQDSTELSGEGAS